ncbi:MULTISPECIES: alpha/beta fold hydrolase [Mycobacterium]|uniref:alpha/beta fold hydrolase n=1 Tax=Mycobacterium TaxID=1763 RepID=UPI001EF33F9D|nr:MULTISPECIES: alpha/beta hydrolase [Mycobacterium]MCG7610066.1 alpha/beta hydrolase [Mycobacterium sp. CnD-18-1]
MSYLTWATDLAAPAVVLLHGGGVDSASLSWGGIGPRLAEAGYRVIAPDHPGYGHTAPARLPVTQERLIAYVGEFVDALGLHSYAIGGLSLGGGMTIGHVLDRPGRVRGAMLLGSYGLMPRLSDGPLSGVRQLVTWATLRTGMLGAVTRRVGTNRRAMVRGMRALITDPDQVTDALMDQVMAQAGRPEGFQAFEQWQRDQVRWNRLRTDYTGQLASFRRPALIVHGDRDSGVPVARARTAAQLIPDAELEIVAGAGHWVQRDQPDAVLAAMTGFLGSLPGR